MKKILSLLVIGLISITAFSQKIFSVDFYSVDTDKTKNGIVFYVKDTIGGAVGVTFDSAGFRYLVVGGGSMPNFSADNREADVVFRKYIVVGSTYGFLNEYRKTISDANYMYGNPTKQNFGVYEDSIYIAGSCNVLKPDLQTEAQFFIDNIIKNKHRLPISISNFIFATIIKSERLHL